MEMGTPKKRLFVRCKFECGLLLEITQSKRHGLIQLRSINFVHSGVVVDKPTPVQQWGVGQGTQDNDKPRASKTDEE